MTKYFVKFAPWNENTLSSIINKTIKFSTVYEFNDFNEYRYIGSSDPCNEIRGILEMEAAKTPFLNNLQTLSAERCNNEYKTKITNFIKEGNSQQLLNQEKYCLNLLQENLAYSSVGIFCISDLDVFEDDSAQLMFAHYAENLKGIALIYEAEVTNNTFREINYNNRPKNSTGGVGGLIEWYNGDYQNMDDFSYKSGSWKYEKEMRIFGKPGIASAKKHNIILRAILYTPRFSGEEKTLCHINNKIYDGSLIIEGMYPSPAEHYFEMVKDFRKTIDFLKDTFFNSPQLPHFIIRQAESKDIDAMVSLSKTKRLAYEIAEPHFWRYAGEEGDNAQRQWFTELLEDKNYVMFTAECDNQEILGFIIGRFMPAPEVYNPGGLTLMIDDFCVNCENLWQSVGAKLIEETKAAAKVKGATQILVVCGAADLPKRKFLSEQNLQIASEWFVGGFV